MLIAVKNTFIVSFIIIVIIFIFIIIFGTGTVVFRIVTIFGSTLRG